MTPGMEHWAKRTGVKMWNVELDYEPLIERFGDTPVHEVPRQLLLCPNCGETGANKALHFVANTPATGDYPVR